MREVRVTRSLAKELKDFSPEQRDVFFWTGEAAVQAGPGSGKTRVLVAKAAHLLRAVVEPPQSVACLTYTRTAADEVRDRLGRLYPPSRGRAWTGTVHSFCLNAILRPLSELAGYPPLEDHVIDESEQVALLQQSFDQVNMGEEATARFLSFTGTRIRRRLATGEGVAAGDDPLWYAAMNYYEDRLRSSGLVDFEGMTIRALDLLRSNSRLARLVPSRYPWLLVDEYQDLGGVLHEIVKVLRSAGTKIVGVGDPNQCVMGFTGADPKYFFELRALPGVKPFDLPQNFRSSEVIVQASDRVLGINADAPRSARSSGDGEYVSLVTIAGGFSRHAEQAAASALELSRDGIPLSEIAVLYKQQVLYPGGGRKVEVKNDLLRALERVDLDYVAEQGVIWPRSALTDFTRDCAVLALDRALGSLSTIRIGALARQYVRLMKLRSADAVADAQGRIHSALPNPVNPEDSVQVFANKLWAALRVPVSRVPRPDDSRALEFLRSAKVKSSTLSEFVGRSLGLEKITVATYQGSKGREWRYVILPYVVEGHIPSYFRGSANASELPEQQRMLHVALSRPKAGAVVLTAEKRSADSPNRFGARSRFLAAFE